jgi:molybdenum cofactor guanylyltransferase
MTRHRTVSAIVLAGGRASRFGADKLAAELDGEALLDRAIASLGTIADEVIVVGRPIADSGTSRFEPGAEPTLRYLADEEPFGGPLTGLAGALDQAIGESAIVVGGDMPRLVPAVLAALLAHLGGDRSIQAVTLAAVAAPPARDARIAPRRQVLPLALAVVDARAAARAALAAGDRSLVRLVERLQHVEVPASAWLALDPDADTLLDVDTVADLDRIRGRDMR